MASDEEYEPNWGEHESPSEQQEGSGWAGAERELDEEDLLRGATTGAARAAPCPALKNHAERSEEEIRIPFTCAAEEDEEDEEDEEEEGGQRSIFAEGQDPLSVLAGMERGGPAGQQPFELLAAANRRRRGRSAAVDVRAGLTAFMRWSGALCGCCCSLAAEAPPALILRFVALLRFS